MKPLIVLPDQRRCPFLGAPMAGPGSARECTAAEPAERVLDAASTGGQFSPDVLDLAGSVYRNGADFATRVGSCGAADSLADQATCNGRGLEGY